MSEGNVTQPDEPPEFEPVSQKVRRIRTPNTETEFYTPSDKVDFDREKYENAKLERKAQVIHAILPNPRCR